MKAREILKRLEYKVVKGDLDQEVLGLSIDSCSVEKGDCFVCIRGVYFDAHSVIDQIAEKGPSVIVVDSSWAESHDLSCLGGNIVAVPDTRRAKALIAGAYYGHPADELTVIGVTGSKGKTTTTHMLYQMLGKAGKKAGLIGSNGIFYDGQSVEIANTTPDSEVIQKYFRKMADAGCEYVILEVSSQAVLLHRVEGIRFRLGVFMNIETGDHIGPNEHSSFAEYLDCKKQLLRQSREAVVNFDDGHLEQILDGLDVPVTGFGHVPQDPDDDTHIPDYQLCEEKVEYRDGWPGISFKIKGKLNGSFYVDTPGLFSASNASAAIACADRLGIPAKAQQEALSSIHVPGRLDMVYRSDELSVCVDFAHNGFSMRSLLTALREYRPRRIVAVFGFDGHRDPDRGIEMGEAAGKYADLTIVTTGHNRYESFQDVAEKVIRGLESVNGRYIVIEDRKEAIRTAIMDSQPGDLIAVAGFGHEHYQQINGVNIPYNDGESCLQVVKEWKSEKDKR